MTNWKAEIGFGAFRKVVDLKDVNISYVESGETVPTRVSLEELLTSLCRRLNKLEINGQEATVVRRRKST